jgi:hypothetical protein
VKMGRIQIIEGLLGKPARSTGAPRKFDAATKQRVQGEFRTRVLDWKAERGRLPLIKEILGNAQELAAAEGVNDASDRTLQRQIVSPVLKKLRREK